MHADLLSPPDVDLQALRNYRLSRIRAQLKTADVTLCVLANPLSLRYAVDFRDYPLFQSRIPTFCLFVPAEGPLVMHGSFNRSLAGVEEYRPSYLLNPFDSGLDLTDRANAFAQAIKDYLGDLGITDSFPRVALDRIFPSTAHALMQSGLDIVDLEPLIEQAKMIKSPEELVCMGHSIRVAEMGMETMKAALEPGIAENQLWSILHQTNIANDGDWIEGRMLASGPRTNPWLQEATDRVIEAGELVAFDTDMVGPFGYCADVSRTWLCPPGKASSQQKDIYQHAYDEVQYNIDLIRPGVSFREVTEAAFRPRDEFIAHRYPCVVHGVGMSDEYPKIYYRQDWERAGYDGMIEAGMVLCCESFMGSERGGEGVKLEEVVHVTETGCECLSHFPFEADLLSDA